MFKVMVYSNGAAVSHEGVSCYVVTDQPEDYVEDRWEGRVWPKAAEFPISMRYDHATQRRRAFEYTDYLNKISVTQPPIGI